MTELEKQELDSIILCGPESNIRDSIWSLLDLYYSNNFSSEVPVCFEYADNLVKHIKSNVKLKYLTVEVNTTVHFPMAHW